ncbi:activator of basal transcription 1 [Nasonia vitripennis]|uniref:Activator of basal transcription 1 n=1 Tax=Nasonia vitripennis TaxID=7425 RepID=A0A7M7QJ89_NASVI|nr:activator of basal transcription 1 [Nasonia vitripennis]
MAKKRGKVISENKNNEDSVEERVESEENEKTEEDQNMEESEEENVNRKKMLAKPEKKKKRGIIYLSTIPRYMNVTKIREIFSAYGEIGRVYLQLADSELEDKKKLKKKKRKTPAKHFTEGWIEFESKKVAKFVAATLNNTQISTRKKSRFYDVIWNIKYLPRFKWTHLSERLAYERAVHKQRLRAEIAQAKREVNFFSYNVDRSKKLKMRAEKGESSNFVMPEIKQRETDMEIRKKKNQLQDEDRTEFLKSLFG